MKINKILILVPLLITLTSCFDLKINLYIGEEIKVHNGNFIDLLTEKTNKKFNYSFSNKEFYMKNFYNNLENEAIDLKSKKTIHTLLKKTKNIVFNIGNYEFLRFVDFNDYKFDFNEKVISTNREMFEYYFLNTLEIIKSYTDNIVVICPFSYLKLNKLLNDRYIKILNSYIDVVNNVCLDLSVKTKSIHFNNDDILGHTLLSNQGALKIIDNIKDDIR